MSGANHSAWSCRSGASESTNENTTRKLGGGMCPGRSRSSTLWVFSTDGRVGRGVDATNGGNVTGTSSRSASVAQIKAGLRLDHGSPSIPVPTQAIPHGNSLRASIFPSLPTLQTAQRPMISRSSAKRASVEEVMIKTIRVRHRLNWARGLQPPYGVPFEHAKSP
jgi:hypothetical protein